MVIYIGANAPHPLVISRGELNCTPFRCHHVRRCRGTPVNLAMITWLLTPLSILLLRNG